MLELLQHLEIKLKLEVGKLLEQHGLICEEDGEQHEELLDGELFDAILEEGELFEGEEQETLLETQLGEIDVELQDEHFMMMLEEWQLDDKLNDEIFCEHEANLELGEGLLMVDEGLLEEQQASDCISRVVVGTLTLQKQSGRELGKLLDNGNDGRGSGDEVLKPGLDFPGVLELGSDITGLAPDLNDKDDW